MIDKQLKIFVASQDSIYLPAIQMAIETNEAKLVGVQSETSKMSLGREIKKIKADVLIISLDHKGQKGARDDHYKLIEKIQTTPRSIKIIAIAKDPKDVGQLIEKQVEGVLYVNEDFQELVKSIKLVTQGGNYYSPKVRKIITQKFQDEHACLTPRETQVFAFLEKNSRDQAIKKLKMKRSTLRTHISNIKTKLGKEIAI